MPAKHSMVKVYLVSLLLLAVVPAVSVAYLWIQQHNQFFQSYIEKSRSDYLSLRQHMLKSEVQGVLNYIEFEQARIDTRMQETLQYRALDLYRQIEALHLRGQLPLNQGRATSATLALLNAELVSTDTTSKLLLDGAGNYLAGEPSLGGGDQNQAWKNRVLELAQSAGEGFVVVDRPELDHSDRAVERLSYLRYYRPLNIIVVTSTNRQAVSKVISGEIVNRLSFVDFDPENPVLFISDLEGNIVVKPAVRHSEDPTDVTVFSTDKRRFIDSHWQLARQDGGGYVEFSWFNNGDEGIVSEPAMNYIKAYPDWGWIVGATFFVNDLDREIESQRQLMLQEARSNVWVVATILVLFLVLAIGVAYWFAQRSRAGFASFGQFFDRAAQSDSSIDLEQLPYFEFEELAVSANRMVELRRHYQQALEDSERRFDMALNYARYFVWDIDYVREEIIVSGDFFSQLGYSEEDIDQHDLAIVAALTHPDDYPIVKEVFRNIETGQGGEYRVRAKDGTYRWHYSRGGVVKADDNGRVLQAVGITADINQRKQIEAELIQAKVIAEDANHAKSQFLSNMSHELRTPLNGILGFAQILLKENNLNTEQRQQLSSIIESGKHLLVLISDILDLSRIDSEHFDLQETGCQLDVLLHEVELVMRRKAESKGLCFLCELAPDLTQPVLLDEVKVKQVLLNLMGNAIKYTRAGQVSVKLKPSKDTSELIFEVRDTGKGIAKEDFNEVFQPFRQLDGYGNVGTGLGLTICRRLAETLNGNLELESELGVGSCFRLILPLVVYDGVADSKVMSPSMADNDEAQGWLPASDVVLSQAERAEMNQYLRIGDIEALRQLLVELIDNTDGAPSRRGLQHCLDLLEQFNLDGLAELLSQLEAAEAVTE